MCLPPPSTYEFFLATNNMQHGAPFNHYRQRHSLLLALADRCRPAVITLSSNCLRISAANRCVTPALSSSILKLYHSIYLIHDDAMFNVDRSHSFVNTNIDTLAFPYHLINLNVIHFINATNTAGVISAATRACVDLGPASSSSWWDYVGSSSGSTRAPAHGAGDATSSIAFTTPASESGRLIDVDGPVGANTGQVGSYRRLARRRKV